MSKKTKPINRKKALTRLMAVQIFFQFYFLNREKNLEEIVRDVTENYTVDSEIETSSYRDKIDEKFLTILVVGLSQNVEDIDATISEFLKGEWRVESLEEVSLQILRLSAFELKFLKEIPAKVIIDEYVDIAASFFSKKRLSFVNAIVDSLAKKLRSSEFGDRIQDTQSLNSESSS